MHDPAPPSGRLARVVLVGFMGAGKSTVGPLLAAHMGWQFIDADRELERALSLTIAEIFGRHGEADFRRMEADGIARLLAAREQVLALGGGALEAEATRMLLNGLPDTCIVYLEAPAETLLSRCERQQALQQSEGSAAIRPLLAELRENRKRLEEKLALRVPHYKIAHLTISTRELTPEQVAELIFSTIGLGSSTDGRPLKDLAPAGSAFAGSTPASDVITSSEEQAR